MGENKKLGKRLGDSSEHVAGSIVCKPFLWPTFTYIN
jgi:hypothetical protein